MELYCWCSGASFPSIENKLHPIPRCFGEGAIHISTLSYAMWCWILGTTVYFTLGGLFLMSHVTFTSHESIIHCRTCNRQSVPYMWWSALSFRTIPTT